MKKIIFLFTGLLFALSLPAQTNVVDTAHYSPSLGVEKPVKVYLPPDYYNNPEEYYPVIYFLHGGNGDHNSNGSVRTWTQSLINNGTIHPVIVVFANGACPPYWGSMYLNSALYGNYEDYIVHDLVAFIDTTFRTLAERNYRCISGFSMGGGGSAYLAIKHPDVYCGFASHAGIMAMDTAMSSWHARVLQENGGVPPYNYTWGAGTYTNFFFTGAGAMSPNLNNPPTYVDFPLNPDGDIIDSVYMKWKQYDNSILVKQISPADNLGIFFSCGTNDGMNLYPSNESFRDTLIMLGLDYVFFTTTGGHNLGWSMFQSGMKFLDSLMFINVGVSDFKPADRETLSRLLLFPNPVVNQLTISYEMHEESFVTVSIHDVIGRQIYSTALHSRVGENVQVINFSGFDSGIYFCRVQAGEETGTQKIIKVQ
jgi:S-formylglutathione hydrolase FrmB